MSVRTSGFCADALPPTFLSTQFSITPSSSCLWLTFKFPKRRPCMLASKAWQIPTRSDISGHAWWFGILLLVAGGAAAPQRVYRILQSAWLYMQVYRILHPQSCLRLCVCSGSRPPSRSSPSNCRRRVPEILYIPQFLHFPHSGA